jgi:hypothetical protein
LHEVPRWSIEFTYCVKFCPCGTSMAWPSRACPAGRPASASLRRRTAPRPGGVPPARGPHHCAPHRARAGPGPSSTIGSSDRNAPGPCPLYEPAAGPIRARSALSRDPRCAARARPPGGPLRRRRRTGIIVTARRRRGSRLAFPPASSPLGPAYAWKPGGDVRPSAGLATQPAEPNTNWQCVIGPRPNRCRRMNLPYRVYRVTS